jgi:arginyl-tRNA synthetase
MNFKTESKIVIGKISNISLHPNAEKTHLVSVDINQKKPLTIVCGDPNLQKGHIVAVALPGSHLNLPSGEILTVGRKEIRGIVSEGIICSPLELGIGKAYYQELILPKRFAKMLGKPLRDYFEAEEVASVVSKKAVKVKPESVKRFELVDKNSLTYQLKKLIWQAAQKFVKDLKISEVHVEHPENPEHGDYATNIAMVLAKKAESKPVELAKKISDCFPETDFLDEIKVLRPGFINFWLSKDWLGKQVERVLNEKEKFGSSTILNGRSFLLEHTSPDPIKTLHVGHLRNNFLGMAVSRILENLGAKVVKDCINNDRGVHVSRAMFGYLVFAKKKIGIKSEDLVNFHVSDDEIEKIAKEVDWQRLLKEWTKNKTGWLIPEDLDLKPDHFDLVVYSVGVRAEDLVEGIGDQVREILQAWEKEDKLIRSLWQMVIDWSLKGYEKTYARIGSVHDHVWHESQLYKKGKELVREGLKKGVFKKSQGAIVSDLQEYGLPDTVLIKSDETALYHTQDLNLTLQKRKKFPSDLYIWDIGNDQILYLKQLYAMCEQLGVGQVSDYFHLNYGFVYLRGKGKMSSRKGTIIKADDLLDEAYQKAGKIIESSAPELRKIKEKEKEEVAELVGLAALKYGLLKFSREKDIYFDIEKSISLEGNSGPYLQYTYARAKSVLRQAKETPAIELLSDVQAEEMALLRTIYKFPEVVLEVAEGYAPNLICNFLFDLAQKFNLFYNQYRIIGSPEEKFRLALTAAVAQVLKNGLELLGIKTLERM